MHLTSNPFDNCGVQKYAGAVRYTPLVVVRDVISEQLRTPSSVRTDHVLLSTNSYRAYSRRWNSEAIVILFVL
jgi:hypothetical protein